MSIYDYEQAFGDWDKTTSAMRKAIAEWFSMYFQSDADEQQDPCQRIAYTLVMKIVRTVFGEYQLTADSPQMVQMLRELDGKKKEAMQLALVGGECYIKPIPLQTGFGFSLIPRNNLLVFARNAEGIPLDVGTVEKSTQGTYYYTLLERRKVDAQGYLTIENRLFRSRNAQSLGVQVALKEHPDYAHLPERYCYEQPLGSVGLVRMKTPMVNCVDGSCDGVSVYAPAVGLIRNIDRNEAQLSGEFSRGESRVIVSADMLQQGSIQSHLFVGLDEDPERVGMTIFSPQLREQSFLARKQEYLRNVESVIGLRRGMLSDANVEERTATEITSSTGDFQLTVMDFQQMWEQALKETAGLCCRLAQMYGIAVRESPLRIDWGNGVLYDQEKTWQEYLQMVDKGLLKPELALAWRFHMSTETQEDLQQIRSVFMPQQ